MLLWSIKSAWYFPVTSPNVLKNKTVSAHQYAISLINWIRQCCVKNRQEKQPLLCICGFPKSSTSMYALHSDMLQVEQLLYFTMLISKHEVSCLRNALFFYKIWNVQISVLIKLYIHWDKWPSRMIPFNELYKNNSIFTLVLNFIVNYIAFRGQYRAVNNFPLCLEKKTSIALCVF